MRLKITKTKSDTNYYIIKDVIKNGKRTTEIFEKLGNIEQVSKRSNGEEPLIWINKYIENLNCNLKQGKEQILIKKSTSSLLSKNVQASFNGGYVFLQKIYYALKLDKTCNEISKKYKFEYDLNSILSRLIYTRILENKLENKYTSSEIIKCLKNMNFLKEQTSYIPTYTRTDITDLLHEKFGFRTDYEILNKKYIKKILK